jgi:NTP pyrophosphatase (non-canonical NTP hydrolase)
MNASEYQAAAMRTECDQLKARVRMYGIRPAVPDELDILAPIRLNHAIVGAMGELGEIAQLLEKWVYYGKGVDRAKLGEEIGDLLWYVAEACNALELDMGRLMECNIAKLRARYPEKYDDHLADRDNRNLAAEQTAMGKVAPPFANVHTAPLLPGQPYGQSRTLEELNEAVKRGFPVKGASEVQAALDKACGADPTTIDGDEDIHQAAKKRPADHPNPFGSEEG